MAAALTILLWNKQKSGDPHCWLVEQTWISNWTWIFLHPLTGSVSVHERTAAAQWRPLWSGGTSSSGSSPGRASGGSRRPCGAGPDAASPGRPPDQPWRRSWSGQTCTGLSPWNRTAQSETLVRSAEWRKVNNNTFLYYLNIFTIRAWFEPQLSFAWQSCRPVAFP